MFCACKDFFRVVWTSAGLKMEELDLGFCEEVEISTSRPSRSHGSYCAAANYSKSRKDRPDLSFFQISCWSVSLLLLVCCSPVWTQLLSVTNACRGKWWPAGYLLPCRTKIWLMPAKFRNTWMPYIQTTVGSFVSFRLVIEVRVWVTVMANQLLLQQVKDHQLWIAWCWQQFVCYMLNTARPLDQLSKFIRSLSVSDKQKDKLT